MFFHEVRMDSKHWRRLRAIELAKLGWSQSDIAKAFDVSPSAVCQWQQRASQEGVEALSPRSRTRKQLSLMQKALIQDVLRKGPKSFGLDAETWSYERIAYVLKNIFDVDYTPSEIGRLLMEVGWRKAINQSQPSTTTIAPKFQLPRVQLYQGDALSVLKQLPNQSVDCIITSPPYYGQRDYEVEGQIGLEDHPQLFIINLVTIFQAARRVLKPSGNLWVNIGDTYWSGKGQSQGSDAKQPHRRFKRPQDYTGEKPWCVPKQQLLIPHRFAVAMQQSGWIVRGDNVWDKVNPTPDPAQDRCASSHEYIFHFVMQESYYFDMQAVSIPCVSSENKKSPPSTWRIPIRPSFKKHIAVFPEELIHLPLRATCPTNGVVLDVFCGSGTVLSAALKLIEGVTTVGIDISEQSLIEAHSILSQIDY